MGEFGWKKGKGEMMQLYSQKSEKRQIHAHIHRSQNFRLTNKENVLFR